MICFRRRLGCRPLTFRRFRPFDVKLTKNIKIYTTLIFFLFQIPNAWMLNWRAVQALPYG
jgi:hypothetical protein